MPAEGAHQATKQRPPVVRDLREFKTVLVNQKEGGEKSDRTLYIYR